MQKRDNIYKHVYIFFFVLDVNNSWLMLLNRINWILLWLQDLFDIFVRKSSSRLQVEIQICNVNARTRYPSISFTLIYIMLMFLLLLLVTTIAPKVISISKIQDIQMMPFYHHGISQIFILSAQCCCHIRCRLHHQLIIKQSFIQDISKCVCPHTVENAITATPWTNFIRGNVG